MGDGIADDTQAIQAAIDASRPGDTVSFPVGAYRTSQPLLFRSGRTYQGQGLPTISPGSAAIIAVTEDDNAYDINGDAMIFDSGGIRFVGTDVAARNIHITNCTFRNIVNTSPAYDNHGGIYIPVAMTDSAIVGNHFYNIVFGGDTTLGTASSTAIVGNDLDNTQITDNTFDNVTEGIYLCFGAQGYFCSSASPRSSYNDVVVSRNTFTRIHRMAFGDARRWSRRHVG
jgi:polygalacturonase